MRQVWTAQFPPLPPGNVSLTLRLNRRQTLSRRFRTEHQGDASDSMRATTIDCSTAPLEPVFQLIEYDLQSSYFMRHLRCLRSCTFRNICWRQSSRKFVLLVGDRMHLKSDVWSNPFPTPLLCTQHHIDHEHDVFSEALAEELGSNTSWITGASVAFVPQASPDFWNLFHLYACMLILMPSIFSGN